MQGRKYYSEKRMNEIILSSFGLDETNISKSAEEISRLLAACRSHMNKEVPEDGEKEVC